MRWRIETKMSPASVAMYVDTKMGRKTSVGDSAPERRAKIEIGIIEKQKTGITTHDLFVGSHQSRVQLVYQFLIFLFKYIATDHEILLFDRIFLIYLVKDFAKNKNQRLFCYLIFVNYGFKNEIGVFKAYHIHHRGAGVWLLWAVPGGPVGRSGRVYGHSCPYTL